jgi:hypothetical protein
MKTVVDKAKIAFKIVRLKGNVEQWEWDRRKADCDCYYATVGKKAGAGLFAAGLLVVLLSCTVMGIYMSVVGLVLQRYFGISSFNSRSLRFRCERYAA